MHPHLLALVAAEHVKDMRVRAAAEQRIRNAYRDQTVAAAGHSARRARKAAPCPQPPCQPASPSRGLASRAA
jgi:hypothetical protein